MRALIKQLSYLILCLSLIGCFYGVAAAQPYPTLSDAPIYFIDVDVNAYQSLTDFLIQHNRESALKTYVVVAKEILDTEADMYIDKLSAAWQAQRPGFSEEEYLILVLGLNRIIEMKFAGKLEARYAVNGKTVLDRHFDSDWLPYARAGDYAVGLKNLITRVEDGFKAEDARLERERAEQERRAEEVRKAEAIRQAQQAFFDQTIPELRSAPIYFSGVVPSDFEGTRRFLEEHNARASFKVRALIVKDVHEEWAALFMDRLVARWKSQQPGFFNQEYLILLVGLNDVMRVGLSDNLKATYKRTGEQLLQEQWDAAWSRAGKHDQGIPQLIARIEGYFKAEDEKQARAQFQRILGNFALIFVILLALIGGIVLFLRQRHLSVKREVVSLLAKTREKLTLAQSHLNQFYEKYKLLFEIDGEVIYKGKTFEIYQSTSKLVNRLQLGVQLLAQQVGKAEHLAHTQFFIGWSKLEKARYALTDEKVLLTTDEVKAGQVKLFSSMNFSLEAQVSQLMESLESYFAESQSSLDQIWNAILESGPAVGKAKEINTQIDAQLKWLQNAKIALEAYETPRSVMLTRLMQADQLLKTDPLSARDQALQAQSELQAHSELLTAMLHIAESQRASSQKLSSVRERIDALRKEGFLLQEEGGPDSVCEEATEGLKALEKALDEADRDKAFAIGNELTELLTFVESKLSQTVEAREKIPSEAVRLLAHSNKLSALAQEVIPALEELKRDFALEAYKTESDNIDEVTAALNECEKRVASALGKADIQCQEYLGAAALLEQVEQAQKQSEVLLNAMPAKHKELKNIREQAQGLYLKLSPQCEQLAQFVKENAFTVSHETEERLSVSQAMLQALTKSMNASKPDWPLLAQQLQSLQQTIDLSIAQAQEEKSNFEKLSQLSKELESKLAITKKYLDERKEDRTDANADYQKAREFLDDIQANVKQGKSNWAELIKKAIRTTELNELSLSRAKQDVTLYEKAMSELRQAEREIQSGDRSFGFGVYAELQPAQQTLQTALSELRIGNYERALSLADEAERNVGEAVRRAYERAQRLQQELYERRRQEEMARAAMTVASVLFSGGGGSRRHSSGGGWSGGSGSSFGGGGGGGSSWGSSSGRSGGWSSSSGRRTW